VYKLNIRESKTKLFTFVSLTAMTGKTKTNWHILIRISRYYLVLEFNQKQAEGTLIWTCVQKVQFFHGALGKENRL
jgi:hypothetical protein